MTVGRWLRLECLAVESTLCFAKGQREAGLSFCFSKDPPAGIVTTCSAVKRSAETAFSAHS